jgi:diacylglycerol kinase (ATP)
VSRDDVQVHDRDLKDPHLDSIPPSIVGGGFARSFRAALAGTLRTIASQRNMKVHVTSALLVAIVGMALPLDLATRTALLFAVAIVWFAEILNTALEAFVDLHVRDYHRLAMLAKDAAAAGVLVLAVFAVLAFLGVLWHEWRLVTENLEAVKRSVLFGVPAAALELLGLFVIRRGALALVRLAASVALLTPLVARTEDPVFAGLALMIPVMSFLARWFYPQRTGRGAPRSAS